MSFISGIYSKIWGTNSKRSEKTYSTSVNAPGTGFREDFDNEDGFVLYTAEQNKRCKQTDSIPGAANFRSYENFQQSCPHPPAPGTPSYSMAATSTGQNVVPQKRDTTFLTVSDIPVQLSKQLQTILQVNQVDLEVSRRSPPNVEKYHYDFSLERDVMRSF